MQSTAEQDNVSFTVIKVRFHRARHDTGNIFTPEFEGRPTSRPLAEEDLTAAREVATETEESPIFLRRRWLATDGGF